MESIPAHEADHGLEPEPRPFSVVLAPTATVAVQSQQQGPGQQCGGIGGTFIRHLCTQKPQQQGRDRDSRRSKHPSSRLSNTIVVVRAQSHTLHLFRGRKLCRVVEFPSPVVDVAGLPWGSSSSSVAASTDTLCVAVCRDGKAYALPTSEILEAAGRGGNAAIRSGKSGHKSKPASSGGGDAGGAPSATSERKRNSRPSSSSAAVGIFDDLAPTILDESQESLSQALAASQQHKDSSATGGGSVVLGGLVIQAQQRWARFIHLGARTVAACSDRETAAVAGIIDRAASYVIAAEKRNDDEGESETPTAGGQHLGTLVGVDGAAPTTSCTVWIEDRDSGCCSALGDGKGFPLSSTVFRSLFGAELSPRPAHFLSEAAATEGDVVHPEPLSPKTTVVLVGDAAGTVRWSPVPPHPRVPGGVLATLPGETTAIVATLPQLDAQSRAVGVLLVGANGAVLSLAATTGRAESSRGRASRKRSRPEGVEEGGDHGVRGSSAASGERGKGGGGTTTTGLHRSAAVRATEQPATTPAVSRRLLGLPFPVASVCSAPGFLLHCHAGALFATALQVAGEGQEDAGGLPAKRFDRFKRPDPYRVPPAVLPLRPVRLPLPCDTIGLAVAPVLTNQDERVGTTTTPNSPSIASATTPAGLQTLVVSLSASGRLVGFIAPQSVEELEGWSLDTGRGGVRVGGNAGVERRLRWQLERLSNLRGQCAVLADESAERDREIRTLRGAAVLLPPLVAAATHRQRNGSSGGGGAPSLSASLAHSISMAPDTQDAAAGFAHSYGGGMSAEQHDALQVRLCVRLWPREGSRARGDLQAVGGEEDGAGRWFVVTRVVAEDGGSGSGGGGGSDGFNGDDVANAAGEGWAWSTSAAVSIGSLRQGWPWSSSVPFTLPSARPVTVSSWLQFRFGGDSGGDSDATSAGGGEEEGALGEAAGVCVELGTSRFDVLDWGVKLSSIPRGAAAVRAASRGRGSSFCGPELAIADVFDGPPSLAGGVGGSGSNVVGARLRQADSAAAVRPPVPTAWSSFKVRVASPDREPGALLSLLIPSSTSSPTPHSNGGGGHISGGGSSAESAIRVAGQVAIVRATDCTAIATGTAAELAEKGPRGGQARGRSAAGSRVVELTVTCSHAAMAPLVREALLRRARVLLGVPPKNGRAPAYGGGGGSGSGGGVNGGETEGGAFSGGVEARGDAVARLAREVHPIKQAVVDAGDEARALGAARVGDGPSAESSKKAMALMYKVGEIYQSLRRQQERFGSTT